ncbi:hypothetical protein CB1_001392002 [Camelus ferus]|nr:hypothetical protein CB1_001392002 [Camelus ferus]
MRAVNSQDNGIGRRAVLVPCGRLVSAEAQPLMRRFCVPRFTKGSPERLRLVSSGMIKQFLRDVDWGEVDYLIVDTPPGTSDEHLSAVQYLAAAHIDGAVIITTPQEVSLQDVRKEISFCRKVKLPVLGVVENMSSFVCPRCPCPTGRHAGELRKPQLTVGLARVHLEPGE